MSDNKESFKKWFSENPEHLDAYTETVWGMFQAWKAEQKPLQVPSIVAERVRREIAACKSARIHNGKALFLIGDIERLLAPGSNTNSESAELPEEVIRVMRRAANMLDAVSRWNISDDTVDKVKSARDELRTMIVADISVHDDAGVSDDSPNLCA